MTFYGNYQQLGRYRRYALWMVMGLLLSGALMFVANWEADRQERIRMESYRGDISDLARISGIAIDDKLRDYDNTLLVLREAYSSDPKHFPENIRLLRSGPLRDRELLVVLVDREGYLAYTDAPHVAPRLYLGNRAYFRFFADGGADRLYIDEPTFGRVTQRYSLPLARPLYDKQGRFLGVVAISVKQESLAHVDPSLQLSGDTTVTVVSHNGAIVSRSRDLARVQGKKLPPEFLSLMLNGLEGVFSSSLTFDGVQRIVAYRHINEGESPLIVYVSSSPKEVLRIISAQRMVLMSGAGFISVLILGLVVLYLKGRKITAELIDTLRKSRKQEYDTLTRTSLDGFFISDSTGLILDVNDTLCVMLGYTQEELLGRSITDLEAPGEYLDGMAAHIHTIIGTGSERFQSQLQRRDGTIIDAEISSQYSAEPIGNYFVFVRDITERRKAEDDLRESEERFKKLFDGATEGILIADAETKKFVMGNKMICNMLQYDEGEINGLGVLDIHPEQDLPYVIREFDKQTRKELIIAKDIPVHRKDGSVFYADVSSSPITLNGKAYLMGMFRDITEHRQLEAQLRQSQKMESIGTLAGGVAHDFNNILSAIVGYGHLSLMKMAEDDPNRLNIQQILEASEKAAHLTKDLLLFSRKQAIDRKPLELNEIIRKLQKFLIRIIGEDIICNTRLSEEKLMISADSHQLEQVLMNLATNARDAMPKGGTFTITTEEVQFDEEFTSMRGLSMPGRYALISISDTGHGMDKETRQRIFEPFFTTKEVGKGTGLGLAVVYGIIKQHEGHINVYSEQGMGTTFRIYLPLMDSEETDDKAVIAEEEPVVGGTETILMAEDDESLLRLNHSVMKEYGYTVIEAVDGEDAVNKYRENKDRIQLLLFDLIMPKMNGSDAYDEIRKITPDIKVIFASGYSPDIVRQKVLLDEDAHLIYKPISPFALLKKVREVLDNAGT